jgi:hypothetical protein
MKATATYLYCLVRDPALAGAPDGLPGAEKVRAVDTASGLSLIVSDAPLAKYGEEAIAAGLKDMDWVGRCAMAHERVVEHFLAAPALLPTKLFTLFADDARAVAHVAKRRKAIDKALARVAGRLEWGVRVGLDPDAPVGDAPARASSSGTAFLAAKKQARDAVRDRSARAVAAADEVHDTLAKLADDTRRRNPEEVVPGSSLVLDAAYLVAAARAAGFQKKVAALAKDAAGQGLALTLTGPWPAYHFVEAGE